MRGIDADIRWNNEGSFHNDELKDLRFDYILANPPFNISDWGGERLREDARWTYGVPPAGNANYAWLQHILGHLAPNGTAGVVLATGSTSSVQNGEDAIRRAMIDGDVIDCIIALPAQLFYSTPISPCLWFLATNKNPGRKWRDRRGQVLFIDARRLGYLVDRTRRELLDAEISKLADTYHAWRGEPNAQEYNDVPGFCQSCALPQIRENDYAITPVRYVGHNPDEDDLVSFEKHFTDTKRKLEDQFLENEKLTAAVRTLRWSKDGDPRNWTACALGDICKFQAGDAFSKDNQGRSTR